MDCTNDVSVVSMKTGTIELLLTTYLPNPEDPNDVPADQGSEPMWEHNLHITMNHETMELEEAKASTLSTPRPLLHFLFQVSRILVVHKAIYAAHLLSWQIHIPRGRFD